MSLSSALSTGLFRFAIYPAFSLICPIYASHNALLYLFVSLDTQVMLSRHLTITLQALFYKG
jgi:hypothetical protein